MSNTVTPNMGMTVPTPGSEPGPLYAQEISNDLINNLDSHDHSTGKGVAITPAGMNVNQDLSFQSNNATNLRSTRLSVNNATLGGVGDLNCVYDVNGNLWFNNGSGTPIEITNGSQIVNSGSVSYSTFNTTGNFAISASQPYVMIGCDPSSNTITITLPAAGAVSIGRLYIVKDATGHCATNNITVSPTGTDTLDGSNTSLTMGDNFWGVGFVSDGVSNWRLLKWNKDRYLSGETLSFNNGSLIEGVMTLDTTTQLNFNNGALMVGVPTVGPSANFQMGGFSAVTGTLAYTTIPVTTLNTPYTISTAAPITTAAICFLVNTGVAITINLPPLTGVGAAPSGMIIVVKDYIGSAGTNNITLVPNASSGDKIEQLAANYLIQTNFGSVTLINGNPTTKGWLLI